MALAHSKVWSFHKRLRPYEGNVDDSKRQWVFDFKELLVSMGWTAEGGYSQNIGLNNNNQVDVLPAYTDYTRNNADFWIHLKSPAALDVELVIGSNYSSGETYLDRMFLYISNGQGSGKGFGSVNGGTNGTSGNNAAPPTSLTQVEIHLQNSSIITLPSGNTFSMYGAVSSDGKNQRIICYSSQYTASWYLTFEHLNNAHPNLDNGGLVFTARINNSQTITSSNPNNSYYTTALYHGMVSGVNRSFYLGGPGYANLGLQSHVKPQADNKIVVHPCDIYNNTVGEQGYYGTVPDLYWGVNDQFAQLLGDTAGGAANWLSGGSLITPWDSTEPLPRIH